jgi:hypothetical protein
MNLLNSISLDNFSFLGTLNNLYVLGTLFAVASFALGIVGMVLGQRLSTNGKLSLVLGLLAGGGTVALFFTPYAAAAPGLCAVLVASFLLSNWIMRLVCGSSGNSK